MPSERQGNILLHFGAAVGILRIRVFSNPTICCMMCSETVQQGGNAMEAIKTEKLTKYYGKARGIIDLDLAV